MPKLRQALRRFKCKTLRRHEPKLEWIDGVDDAGRCIHCGQAMRLTRSGDWVETEPPDEFELWWRDTCREIFGKKKLRTGGKEYREILERRRKETT